MSTSIDLADEFSDDGDGGGGGDGDGGDGGRSSRQDPAPNPITPKDSISHSGIPLTSTTSNLNLCV